MTFNFNTLAAYPTAFIALTGLKPVELRRLAQDLHHDLTAADIARRTRPNRKRAVGAGRPYKLSTIDQVMAVCIARRFGLNFAVEKMTGLSEKTLIGTMKRILPLLRAAGHDPCVLGEDMRRQLAVAAYKSLPDGYSAALWLIYLDGMWIAEGDWSQHAITGQTEYLRPRSFYEESRAF